MAKIELDISEYDLMRDKARLLEDALKREKELSAQIDKLNQEKIDVMEQNKKSVTIIEEKRVTQVMYNKVSDKEAVAFLMRISQSLNRDNMYFMSQNGIFDYIISSLFNQIEMHDSPPQEKKVVYKGLDDVIETIRKEYVENMSKDTKKKLDKLEEVSNLCSQYKNTISDLRQENKITNSVIKKLSDKNNHLEEKNEKLMTQFETLPGIAQQIGLEINDISFFNKKEKRQKIFELLIKWENYES